MEITKYVVSGRDKALLYGDYSTYRAQLSHRLLSIRKRLGRTTKKGAKYSHKAPVTAEDIGNNVESLYLQISTAERAWAHAMYMKSAHASDTKGITGSTRSHIISRLHKASTIISELLVILKEQAKTGASETDVLELQSYQASLKGAEEFEKQSWEACVRSYSKSWVLYNALAKSTSGDAFKDLLSATIEPSIRYGAYQMRLPRTIGIPVIVRKYFPTDDASLTATVEKLDPTLLKDSASKTVVETTDSDSASRTITWRSRTVELEDASIAVALEAVAVAKTTLTEKLATIPETHSRQRAAAYDDILIASQDAVDSAKHAIDELVAEGVGQGDKRMQALQITRTAISYDMISWRIGRNRVLTGAADGSLPHVTPAPSSRPSKKPKREEPPKEESPGRKLARLKDKVVMYDSTLQSLDSIKELPGVAADTAFVKEIDAKRGYFRALKCLAIARSYDVISDSKNALALLSRASTIFNDVSTTLFSLPDKSKSTTTSSSSSSSSSPATIALSTPDTEAFQKLLSAELQRHRALVDLSNIVQKSQSLSGSNSTDAELPLIERLDTYPANGSVDLKNLVTYPPKVEPIPVKPLFFDVAWNYIQYPGHTPAEEEEVVKESVSSSAGKTESVKEQPTQQKKGWFGFGR